ncbi:MAG: HD domain-containing protein, partial [Deltaproteobacteria bacterium]|nr:HD domain-containing protein [Deltaproteobacteria bacterium]
IQGRSQVFNGNLQLTLSYIAVEKGPIDPARFLPHGDKHVPTMEVELKRIISDLRNPWLRRLNEAFFVRDQEFARAFALAPAAKAMHHAWLGGLLEHTLGVARLALKICPLYPQLDADLVLSGALLHDIGKVEELVYERSFDYSTPGRLLGHISLGVRMIHERAAAIKGFPAELLLLLEHLILSHHGEYEYGSPKRPKTLEALLLNFIDDLDAKLVGVETIIKGAGSGQTWTDFHRLFGRPFFVGFPEPAPAPESAEPAPAALPPDDSPRLF